MSISDNYDPYSMMDPDEEEWLNERWRARAIRAVVAAQWAVACAIFAHEVDLRDGDPFDREMFPTSGDNLRRRVAALPTPEQIVDGDA